MRNTSIVSIARPAVAAALALFISMVADAVDSKTPDVQNSTASLLDQLLSPPAPLRDSATNSIAEPLEHQQHWFTSAGNTDAGTRWQFAVDRPSNANSESLPVQLNNLQQFSSAFTHQVTSQHSGVAAQAFAPEHRALLQSVSGFASSLLTLPSTPRDNGFALNASPSSTSDGNRQLGQWLANAAQYAGNLQISAAVPLDASFLSQAPTETVTAAINSKEVTQYLEHHNESVTMLAQLLGWQKTGLLPSATDLQKMAADHVGAVTSSVERWALQNVSFSATSQAITNTDTQGQVLQWQWSASSTSQYNSNSVADNEANFSVNLRRLFGMNDYY